jgi:hypothetical protein
MSRHVNEVKLFVPNPNTSEHQLLDLSRKDDNEYEIDFIEAHTGDPKKTSSLRFKVHWVGYENPSWEPWRLLKNTEAIEIYAKSHRIRLPKEIVRIVKPLRDQ